MNAWLKRQRYFLDFTMSSLWRRKGKNFGLVLCYALIVFLLTSVLFFTGSIRSEALSVLDGAPEILVQRMAVGRQDPIPIDYAERIKEIRGVRQVKPRLWGYYYHPASKANYTVMVPDEFTLGEDAAVVGTGVLRTWQTEPGGLMYFRAYDGQAMPLKIKQSFTAQTDLVTADLILVGESTFRKIFGLDPGRATDLAVSVSNAKETPTIVEKISQALPDTRQVSREDIKRTYVSLFDWRSGYILVLLTGAVLAFCVFALDKATGLSAEEKKEIAVLKAVGWDTGDVLGLKFWEGQVVSWSAFLLGVIAAYVHVFLAPAPLFEEALKGWATLYPRFRLAPVFSVYELAVVFAVTVVPYTFITIIPAWRAASEAPDAVMRPA